MKFIFFASKFIFQSADFSFDIVYVFYSPIVGYWASSPLLVFFSVIFISMKALLQSRSSPFMLTAPKSTEKGITTGIRTEANDIKCIKFCPRPSNPKQWEIRFLCRTVSCMRQGNSHSELHITLRMYTTANIQAALVNICTLFNYLQLLGLLSLFGLKMLSTLSVTQWNS